MSEPISRRKAITGVAVGGAVVWAAPTIVSVSAASAQTLEPPPPDNLIQNPSFESDASGPDVTSWTLTEPG
jgi:hypothetical protein